MVTVSAGWPGERRELSRFATAGGATTQHGALLALLHFCPRLHWPCEEASWI
jgi:hypothetical protein